MSPDQSQLSLCAARVERELSPGGVPEWVHLLPRGEEIRGRDGRNYYLSDPEVVIRAFHANGADLPIDYEHQSEKKEALLSGPVPAAGWIKAMEARDTGLWARVEWTDRARDMIANREYRYLSPTIICRRENLDVVAIRSAGLVHRPNLHLTAITNQETPMETAADILPQIIAALDLPADTSEEEVLSIIARMKGVLAKVAKSSGVSAEPNALADDLAARLSSPDPAKFVPIETVQAMLAERNVNIATMSEERVREKVSDATRKGYLSPAMKDWAIALCRSDEVSFDKFVSSSVPAFAHLSTELRHLARAPERGNATFASDEEQALCAQLGIKPSAFRD